MKIGDIVLLYGIYDYKIVGFTKNKIILEEYDFMTYIQNPHPLYVPTDMLKYRLEWRE